MPPAPGPRHRRRRTVPWTWAATGAAVAVSTAANLAWVLRDHTSPSWDQSHYLWITAVLQHALDHHGPVGFVRALYTTDPSRAPLWPLAMLPMAYVLGPGPGMGLAVNLVLWPVLLLATGAVAARLFGETARVVATLVLLPMPLVLGLAHTELQDYLLLVLSVLAVWLLVRARRFSATAASVLLGVVLALGSLCKASFLVSVAGPFAVTVVAAALAVTAMAPGARWPAARRPARNLGLCALVALSPLVIWYVPNWSPTLAYLRQQRGVQPGSVRDPLSPDRLAAFAANTARNMSKVSVVLVVVLAVAALPWLVRRLGRHAPGRRRAVLVAAFVGSWFAVPLVVLATNHTQDPRYAVAAYPALAVIAGGLVAKALSPAGARLALAAVAAVAVVGLLEADGPAGWAPYLPEGWSPTTSAPTGGLPLSGPDGPAVPPSPTDRTLAVLAAVEADRRAPGGGERPATVVIPELEQFVNGNDLSYYAYVRGDPFTFVTLDAGQRGRALRAALAHADVVLYARPAPLAVSAADGRVGILNERAAARHMTPAMFSLFAPHPRRIDVGSDVGQSPYVAVLVRRGTGPPP